ncbi:hypothetical protein HD599_001015 [Conyzicola lurida]|uniref:Uncharacterized protein n=1 Tax=Conyzicola lurida TaxID=1172621 RepID=A0A841AL50_9MICO|nr:hypothetical protein [Conyzicola lurida]MBB5842692.1 hypothetical protein [Conyzicola lurida]
MVTLDELYALRPEGIDFSAVGHTVTIMPTAKTRRLGLGVPDVKLDWQVLSDGNTVGYLEAGQDVILAWKPTQLDDGLPAETTSVDEAIAFLAGDPPKPQHHHNKHPHTKR